MKQSDEDLWKLHNSNKVGCPHFSLGDAHQFGVNNCSCVSIPNVAMFAVRLCMFFIFYIFAIHCAIMLPI